MVCVCVLTWADKHSSYALAKSALVTLLRPFLAVIVPRLLYTAFTFSQPLLLRRIVGFLGENDPSTNVRNGLIGATVLIYFGLAVRFVPPPTRVLGIGARQLTRSTRLRAPAIIT